MKKYYSVLAACCAISAVMAQNNGSGTTTSSTQSDPTLTTGAPSPQAMTDAATGGGTVVVSGNRPVVSRGNVNYSNQIRIGSTWYDLQTNAAMPHRLILHPDGSVSATWTTCENNGAPDFAKRGAGYNFRSSAGAWGMSDSSKIDSLRTGWPNIGVLSNGTEFIIGHDAANGGFWISYNTALGARNFPFNKQKKILAETGLRPIWARMANNGDTIHMIYSYSDSAAVGDKRAPKRLGITAPMVYSRSLNGGQTWDIQHIMLPGWDSTLTTYGGSDQYAIDCKGNTVAIVNGDGLQGVVCWKSTDFGTNFTRIFADTFDYAPYKSKTIMDKDTITNDGTVDVILDKNNKMHVFWGIGRAIDRDTSDDQYQFGPMCQGIGYWNESMSDFKVVARGNDFDRDGDDTNILNTVTWLALTSTRTMPKDGNGDPVSTVARLTSTSAMRSPNASIDENGNIYVVYSIPIEGDVSDLDANFRDIGVVYSTDGGATWAKSQNLTQAAKLEDDFATTARQSNGFLHVMWQRDVIPGTNLGNNSDAVGNHEVVLNEILYQAIPVSQILNDQIGMQWGLNVDKQNTGEVMVVNQNYPNPFTGITNVLIYLTRPGDVKVSVHNMAGAEVLTNTITGLQRGNHNIEMNCSGLPAGVYTYSLTSGGSTVSKTMIIK